MCQGIISSTSNMTADTANTCTVFPQRHSVISPLVTIGTSAALAGSSVENESICCSILASCHIKSEIFQWALS